MLKDFLFFIFIINISVSYVDIKSNTNLIMEIYWKKYFCFLNRFFRIKWVGLSKIFKFSLFYDFGVFFSKLKPRFAPNSRNVTQKKKKNKKAQDFWREMKPLEKNRNKAIGWELR